MEYDFIIIGAGSSGATLAHRLSGDPSVNVLLLEAGGKSSFNTKFNETIPAAVGKLQRSEDIDWGFYAEPQPGRACTHLKEGRSYWPRGKGFGGSSRLNYMTYVRGNRSDFDEWESRFGAKGWNYENLLPLFKKSEDSSQCSPEMIESEYHGIGGPLSVSTRKPANKIAEAFVKASENCGHPIIDYNGKTQFGVGLHQQTVRHGQRCSTAKAFLDPIIGNHAANRKNFYVRDNAHVGCIKFEINNQGKPQAIGVEIVKKNGNRELIRCNKEVILSAGVIGSPHILLLSGIGPKEELENVGIEPIPGCDISDVGKNLQDHMAVPIRYNPKKGQGKQEIGSVNTNKAEGPLTLIPNLFNMFVLGEGILTSSAYDASLFLKMNENLNYPDIQISIFAAAADRNLLEGNLNLRWEWMNDEDVSPNAEGVILTPTLLHPKSKGKVSLRSVNPFDSPKIEAGYLSDPGQGDLSTLVYACQHAQELRKKQPLNNLLSEIPLLPPDLKQKYSITESDSLTEEFWQEYIRRYGTTLYHPAGTCRIGSVVDHTLKVNGINGLRIADASIQPEIVSGNTHASCVMIGEKAADLISEEYGLKQPVI